jgi:hypothetical protein
MWPESEEPQSEPEAGLRADEDAPTDEPPTDVTGSPFTTPQLQAEFRNLTSSFAPVASGDEQDEPATPSEPRPEESPFTTPEVEEIERGEPAKSNPDQRDA